MGKTVFCRATLWFQDAHITQNFIFITVWGKKLKSEVYSKLSVTTEFPMWTCLPLLTNDETLQNYSKVSWSHEWYILKIWEKCNSMVWKVTVFEITSKFKEN